MSAGGVAAPVNDASEEYGATAPRHEQFPNDDDQTSASTGSSNTKTTSSSSDKTSGNAKSSGLNNISSEKKERDVKMNEQDVQHASASHKNSTGEERSKNRAPQDAGPKEDIEQLHGKASLAGNDRSQDQDGGKQDSGKQDSGKQDSGKQDSGKQDSGKQGSGKSGSSEHEGHELESNMRHKAEQFVNLDDEEEK
jgi:hypothetical protein